MQIIVAKTLLNSKVPTFSPRSSPHAPLATPAAAATHPAQIPAPILCSMAAPASSRLGGDKDRLGSGSGESKTGAAPWDPARSGSLLRSLRGRSRSLPCPADRSSADRSDQQFVARPRLQSVAVLPSAPEVNITASEEGPK